MSGFDSERHAHARAVYAHADCIVDEARVNACYARMAGEIEARFAGLDPVILCVMLGGMQATVEITKRLNFAFEFDYLHATRYRGDTDGGELVWKVMPEIRLADRHVLVIDDILDEGHTLAAILHALEAQAAASVRTAILLQKRHDRRPPALTADILGCEVEDRYVFGAGMDYKGYFRQLPAVYAANADTPTTRG